MAGLGKKTFAAGEVLRAADVNGYLMDQSVMSFAGTAARGSAIGTASEGMVSYLADSNDVEVYTGSAWQNPAGLTLITSQTISGTSSFSLNNIFNSKYENYRVMISNFQTTAAGIVQMFFRMRLNGVDAAGGTDYATMYMRYYIGGTANGASTGQAAGGMGYFSAGGDSTITFDIFRPALADTTTMQFVSTNYQSDIGGWIYATGTNIHKLATAYDGITIAGDSGTLSGLIRVYGYRTA